jgi:hypothetical protein
LWINVTMTKSQWGPALAFQRGLLPVVLLAAIVLHPDPVTAQQDTSRHAMPGMPGMKMPAPQGRAAAKAKSKPAAKSKPRAKSKPVAKSNTAPAVSTHPAAHDTMSAMPSMSMPGASHGADSTGRRAPAAKAEIPASSMPAMDMARPRVDTGRAAQDMASMPGMSARDTSMAMHMMTPDPLGVTMDRMGSGTTWVPDAAPIPSVHFNAPRNWDVTGHGFAFLQYDLQGGPRGASQVGSLNWLMLMASHALAGGRIQARTMLSLDAATVTPLGYPLLLQTGEAYEGEPLHDRQHPHDMLMELSALYEKPITSSLGVMLYAAPSGEPALGPVAFMHRPSAMDNPTAPITHHWSDATHISFGVLSAGLFTNAFKIEGSVFNGREPDQYRFNIDPIRLDSYSARATLNPGASWSFTTGYGYLASPEALAPNESLHRVTASALHGATLGAQGQWASSLVYGANRHSGQTAFSHSVLLESEAVLDARNSVFGRAEYVQKSAADLALDGPPYDLPGDQSFNVGAFTLGYIRDFARFGAGTLGVGAMGTLNVVPSSLASMYGSRTPAGAFFFLRVRPFRTGMSMRGPLVLPAADSRHQP